MFLCSYVFKKNLFFCLQKKLFFCLKNKFFCIKM